ncbi:antibiotic biosynthesis monooxygenase, partial [Stieleria sp.]|uniref:antibiotic biosynthesis monooxygenase family protein n=1 Tax=Stieleria sp. TaxID=2795976 RepID=UPI003563EF15
MHVVISQFVVANDKDEEVRQAFQNRPHLVDRAPGFRKMEVISPVDEPEKFWLMTYWDDVESFESWHRSHHYRDSHA